MWTRVELKDYAKRFLKDYYWKAFIVCLIAALVMGGSNSSSSSNRSKNNNNLGIFQTQESALDRVTDKIPTKTGKSLLSGLTRLPGLPFRVLAGGFVSLLVVVTMIIWVTLGYAIDVGKNRFFLSGFKGDVSIGKIASPFNSEEYLPIVKTQFLKNLYNALWYLALIVPGIIKSYEYRFVPYILAEHPTMDTRDVIETSRNLTNGQKWDMFVLDVSFWGWYLLGSLLFGLGVLFVNPYKEATFARLYRVLADESNAFY